MLIFIKVQVALGFFILGAKHTVGRGELGHDQAASTEIADESPEDGVGDSGHRSKDRGGRNRDRADLQAGRNDARAFASGGAHATNCCRVVPVLAHFRYFTCSDGYFPMRQSCALGVYSCKPFARFSSLSTLEPSW